MTLFPDPYNPFLPSHMQESGNMKSAVDFATAVVFGPAPKMYQMAKNPPIREDFMKESQAMVPIDLMSNVYGFYSIIILRSPTSIW